MSHFIALTCEAMARSVYAAAANVPHPISVRLLKQGLHDHPRSLNASLQAQIDTIEPQECDAILLVYGICGRSTIGLKSRHTPLVMPRAHDCITLYLGSQERYQQEFNAHPGTYWYSVDYLERLEGGSSTALGAAAIEANDALYEEYVQKYGKDNADMLIAEIRRWAQHYTRAAFIDTGLGDTAAFEQVARAKAKAENWVFERKQGNRRLVEMLVSGQWPEREFLVVPPGKTIRQACDETLIDVE